jgi:nucleoside-diphosphate-sugar epimerase
MERQKVLITGGAGFLGINLIRHLLARGYEISSLDVEEFDYPERGRIETIKADIRDKALVDRAMEGIDLVVHTAAALPLYSPEDIYTTDVEGTRNVLEAARRHGVERVVHVSSTAVYGIPDHHPLYETDKLEGVGPYGQAKIQAEMICLEYRARGTVVPIIRPKSFVGPERLGVFALLYDWAFTGHNFPMIGSGNNRYQLLDVEDLCEAIYLTLTLPEEQVNDTFNIGAKEFTTMKEDYQAVLDYAGHGKKVVGFPAAPAIWGLRILDKLGLSPLYKWVYETASKDSLLWNFRWYLENRAQFENASGVSHRVPWKQGAIGLLKRFF